LALKASRRFSHGQRFTAVEKLTYSGKGGALADVNSRQLFQFE
jgi:hypothetical protein